MSVERPLKKAQQVDPRHVEKKALFCMAVLVGAITALAIDILAISQGWATTEPGRRLVVFLGFCFAALALVALLSYIAAAKRPILPPAPAALQTTRVPT